MNIQDALDAVRRHSSVGRTPQPHGQIHYIDLYHRGQGQRFQMCADELATLIRRGLQVTNGEVALAVDDCNEQDADKAAGMVQRGCALLAWLEARTDS